MAEVIKMPFGTWTRVGPKELCARWSPDPYGKGTFDRMMSGFSHTPPSTVPSGHDVMITPYAVDQHSNWLAAAAVSVTLNFLNE